MSGRRVIRRRWTKPPLCSDREEHVWDAMRDGYVEALTRNWQPLEDMRLSEKDANTYFSMNTHLHLLEPYALNLLRVWREDRVATAVRKLIHIHTDRLFDPQTGHLNLFFDARWQPQGRKVSYGHDIEASWLIDEAALVLGEPQVTTDVGPVVEALAAAAVEGLRPDGSLIYEYDPQTERIDADRHWWVQAEAVVGFSICTNEPATRHSCGGATMHGSISGRTCSTAETVNGSGASAPTARSTVTTTRQDSGNAPITTAGCAWN